MLRMRRQLCAGLAVACVLALTVVSEAQAQRRVSGGGYALFVPHGAVSMEMPDGSTIERSASQGHTVADDPNNPLQLVSFDCNGLYITPAGGSAPTWASGHCDGVDRDGHAYTLWWRGDANGGEWGFIAGTGKFADVKGGGTYTPAAAWPDGKTVTRWEGNWTMK